MDELDNAALERRAPAAAAAAGRGALRPGTALGDYRIVRLLGRGGMGEVYLAEPSHTTHATELRLALKVLAPRFASNSYLLDCFKREAEVMMRLRHENIVPVRHLGRVDLGGGTFYLTMDYIEGPGGRPCTLEDELAVSGRLSEPEARHVAMQICDALAYAHGFRDGCVIHGDLKPANVLLAWTPDVAADPAAGAAGLCASGLPLAGLVARVTDFGIARIVHAHASAVPAGDETVLGPAGNDSIGNQPTQPPQPGDPHAPLNLGTPDYMCPEQKARGELTPRSDIYSLGVLLYRLLTGEKPIGAYEPPSSFGVSRGWDPILEACLQQDPAARPSEVRQVREWLAGLATPGQTTETRTVPTPRPARLWQPRQVLLAGTGVLVVAGLATAGLWWHQRGTVSPAPVPPSTAEADQARARAVAGLVEGGKAALQKGDAKTALAKAKEALQSVPQDEAAKALQQQAETSLARGLAADSKADAEKEWARLERLEDGAWLRARLAEIEKKLMAADILFAAKDYSQAALRYQEATRDGEALRRSLVERQAALAIQEAARQACEAATAAFPRGAARTVHDQAVKAVRDADAAFASARFGEAARLWTDARKGFVEAQAAALADNRARTAKWQAERTELRQQVDAEVRARLGRTITPETVARQMGLPWPVPLQPKALEEQVTAQVELEAEAAAAEKHPPMDEAALRQRFGEKYVLHKTGERVAFKIRGGLGPNASVSGVLRTVTPARLQVGDRWVLCSDMQEDDLVLFVPEARQRRIQQNVAAELARDEAVRRRYRDGLMPAIAARLFADAGYAKSGDQWVPLKEYAENACATRRDQAEPGLRQEIESGRFREHGYVRFQGDWVPRDEVPFLEWQARAATARPATTQPPPTAEEGVPVSP